MSHAKVIGTRTAPILLSGQVSINPGQTVSAPTQDLTSPFREAIWVDSIHWTAFGRPGSPVQVLPWNWGGTIRTRLVLGRTELTRNRNNAFVPIWNFGPQVNDNSASLQFDRESADPSVAASFYKWKLPRPLYVPPGMSLQSEFSRTADGGPNGVVVSVGYAGRYVDPSLPTLHEIDVPLVCFAEAAGTLASFMSNENDFVNPYLTTYFTQRFILRAQETRDVGSGPYLSEATNLNTVAQVKVQDTYGVNIVRDFLDWNTGVVFDANRRAWTFNKTLEPKERYNVQFRPPVGSATFGADLMLSLVGWRKEAF